jgi:hypothetical protein
MPTETYKPANIIIKSDEANREFHGSALTFYNVGSWLVEIDGLPILPGGSLNESLDGQNIKHNYQIKFTTDLSANNICSKNPATKNGKFLVARMLIKS